MKAITALAPWFGSNRTLAENIGHSLTGCEWVGVPFAGGMCELMYIKARTILVSDLHRHVINLAAVVADAELSLQLQMRLTDLPHHSDVLKNAQSRCLNREHEIQQNLMSTPSHAFHPDLDWACDYFVCCWWARNGSAGTDDEFEAGLSVRWNSSGGDSAQRVRNAIKGIAEWQRIMRRCTFVRLDVFEFLKNVKDQRKHGLYLDPPFPGPGDKYKHCFSQDDHKRLSETLLELQNCRVVCRFYDHPLVRELYLERYWNWYPYEGRKQTNDIGPEVILIRKCS